nr:integrase, catalytic region, zinc finger, CCHC-type, peptidase aspartic, catalytic [Tanacetum cinerariifolium]
MVQNFEIQFLQEASKFVRDFKSLAKEADESLDKQKSLELKIERLLKASVSHDIMPIVQNGFFDVPSDLQTKLDHTKEKLKLCIIKKEKEYAVLWNNWYTKCEECKYDKISYDKADNDMQQKKLESKIVELEFQVVNYEREISHLKTTYKNMFYSISSNWAHAKLHDLIYKNAQLRARVFENTFESMKTTSGTSVTSHFDKPKLSVVTPHSKKLHASIPSHSVPQPKEFNVVKHRNVIAPGMFKINPSQTPRVDLVSNKQSSASIRTNPITNSQRHVIVKENVISNTTTASSTGTLLLSKNQKTMSSECNNIKLAIRNDKSEIVCDTCKQCLVTANHDACFPSSVNALNSRANRLCANVVQICLWCVDSGCSKHMTGNIKLLINFVWKFLRTVRFGNDYIAAILGYGDLKWGNITITRVYFVEGLGHNLFSVGQFYDDDLEVAFRRNTCFIRDLDGVDLLKGNRSTNLYTINLYDMASASPICLMARATPTKSCLWHQRLSHLNFDTINNLAKNDLVSGLPKFKYAKEHLCPFYLEVAFRRNACFVRNLEGVDLLKGDRSTNLYTINLYEMASASPICLMARASSTKSWLWHQRLSHLNLDTINDLARNDLVAGLPKFKYHKEHLYPSCEQGKSKRASHPPKPVLNSRQRLHLLHLDLCGPMRIASINGKRYILVIVDDYSRYMWNSRTKCLKSTLTLLASLTKCLLSEPQQNGVVERRNRTLVEAARTMLIFSRAPLFLWAEAIATACFTQNRSIIHRRFNKTPYELINGRKPDISFLYVFGDLCYLKNDREDIGKLGAKGDIGFFIGYSVDSCAYRIYNRRTKKIMETMNVSFDELSAMAFEQRSSKPGLQCMTSGQINSGLDLTYAPSIITKLQPTKGELGLLFAAMYDDYFGGQPSATMENVPPVQEPQDVDELNPNAMVDVNTFLNPFATSSSTAAETSSSQNTKDHPLEQVIGEPSRPVLTRNQLRSDGDMCIYALTVSTIEPKNVKETMTDPAWIESMQEELLQFQRMDVWVLVPIPDNISPLTLKWIFKNKHDKEQTVIKCYQEPRFGLEIWWWISSSESRPPMLNKENYVPWSSRLLRYAKSRPNRKLIHNSIINGPYVRRMIPEPGDANREVTVTETFHVQTDDELTKKELKQIEANDQAIETILLGLPEDIYAAEKKAKLFNEWERFTSNEGESIESYYHHFLKLMNDLKRNKHFLEKIASNLKFVNNLQPEWSRHVTIVHQTKDLHTADYTKLYDFLKYNQKEVDELKAERFAKTQDPLALMENSNNPYAFPAPHQDQSSFNQNCLQQPILNPDDITDPTTSMNMALALMAKAFKQNYSTPTNNNQRILSNPCNRNQNGLIGVQGNGNQNQIGNGNLVAARTEGNAAGQNENQIRCYNCRGVGHFARNCTVRPRRRDAAYLQTQLLIAQKEEAGIQLQAEEYDLMAAVADLDEIEEVNANCILMANLQQASISGTQTDKAHVYDSDGSAEVHENCDDNEIFNMFTQEEQYTELLEPIPESRKKPDILFLHVFGALCYPKNDREDLGKLGAKGDIGFFIGYSADSYAYRIYNRRKKKIMEAMNLLFDELSMMAFEQRSSKPELQSITYGQISLGLDLTYAPSTITTQQPTEGLFMGLD